jgi:dTDP-4-amino-4,6-dideoxygalactose transaminase
MKVPFLDLKAQYKSIKEEVNPAIQTILDNTAFVLGKPVEEFESAFAKAQDVKHVVGVSSGTDGNHLALSVLNITTGDEIIVPANTFFATAWGATLCRATPVFVDCEPDSYNLDPLKVEAAITPRTKAIVVVHLYGQAAHLEPLMQIAKKHNLFLVEDCAQAHLSEYNGKPVGGYGITSSFSFYPGKNLGAYGEAGAFSTNDDALAMKAKMLRDHGAVQKYNHELYGQNYRMEGIQGAVLGVKLKHLRAWTEKRRAVAKRYNELLDQVGDIVLPKEMPYAKHVYHLFVIQTTKRDTLQQYLTEKGIGTGLHYPIPLHLQPCFAHLGYKKGDMPVAERLADRCLSIPMYAELTNEQIEYVCNTIRLFFVQEQ